MTASFIEAIYVYDQNSEIVLEHAYASRPPSARSCLVAYRSLAVPRPAVSYHGALVPPATLTAVGLGAAGGGGPSSVLGGAGGGSSSDSSSHSLLFLVPSTRDSDPLATLTFLGRLADMLEDFLGSPLTAPRIASNYDVVAQILAETVDGGGTIATTEPNALRESVTTQGWVDKLLGGVGLPSGPTPSLQSSGGIGSGGGGSGGGIPNLSGISGISSSGIGGRGSFRPGLTSANSAGPQVPWRRPNVRHTSNELYVDMVESVRVLLAPSGRPLSARVHGSILFTAKLSGVPDLVLNLSAGSGGGSGAAGKSRVARIMQAPSFHPCVRLNRWRDSPGELSFVPPDGKFMLAGYEADLLSDSGGITGRSARQLADLPVSVQVLTGLGGAGADFEVRLAMTGGGSIGAPGGSGAAAAQLRALTGRSGGGSGSGSGGGSGRSTPGLFGARDSGGTSSAPVLGDVVVRVPVPAAARNVRDLRASRGEAAFDPRSHLVEWRIGAREAGSAGVATLRCTVVGPPTHDDGDDDKLDGEGADAQAAAAYYGASGLGDYDETTDAYQEGGDGGYHDGDDDDDANTTRARATATATTTAAATTTKTSSGRANDAEKDADLSKTGSAARAPMPRSAAVSFAVRGWLASGLRVESLSIDTRRSRGLGDGVRPVKGVKYLTLSRAGLETRC